MDQATANRCSQLLQCARTPGMNPAIVQSALREARALIDADAHQMYPAPSGGGSLVQGVPHSTIQLDQVHPPAAGDYIQPLMAPSRFLVVPDLPDIPPDTTVTGFVLDFSAGGGWLIGWQGIVADFTTVGAFAAGELEQASMGVKAFLNDGEELITNGVSADFVPFANVFRSDTNYSPIMRRVDSTDRMFFEFRNFQPAVQGAQTLRPAIVFAFWREKYPGT